MSKFELMAIAALVVSAVVSGYVWFEVIQHVFSK